MPADRRERRRRYRIHLEPQHDAPATVNLRLAAVRRIAYEAADAGLTPPCANDQSGGVRSPARLLTRSRTSPDRACLDSSSRSRLIAVGPRRCARRVQDARASASRALPRYGFTHLARVIGGVQKTPPSVMVWLPPASTAKTSSS